MMDQAGKKHSHNKHIAFTQSQPAKIIPILLRQSINMCDAILNAASVPDRGVVQAIATRLTS
jgi:hypothetical protein